MIKKTLGFVLTGLGLVGVAAWSLPEVKNAIPNLNQIADMPLIIVSAILAIVGLLIVSKGRGRGLGGKRHEVPIYHGKHVIGYRRH